MLSTKLKAAAGNSADATLYVNDVFSTYLYTGNNTSQNINNGIDLAGKGGMVWQRSRTSAQDNHLWDTARGANYDLVSNSTAAQYNRGGTNGVTSFNSDGFTITGNQGDFNASSDTYASWTFRKAAKFFDIVTWTGDGNTYPATRTLNHSLGIAPGMIVIKVTSAVDDWVVYHAGLPSPTATYLRLNTTEAARSGTIIDQVTSTSFRITDQLAYGADSLNQLNQTYVAYVFAHNTAADSMIKCGSFTTNGQTFINLGWEPQYVLMKNTTNYGWQIMDTMRGIPTGGITTDLEANNSNAERNMANWINVNDTGFTANGGNLGNNVTFIYMAIRRPNKPPTSGTQVFSAHTWTQSGGL